jgi:hypothetical protein
MNRSLCIALAALPLALTLACTDANKVPAEAAVQAAESAVASLGDEASKLLPDQTKAVQDALASAQALAAKKDFKGALAAATEIPAKVKDLAAAVAAKKDELAKAAAEAAKAELMKKFDEASGPLGQMLDALKSRVGILSQAKKLPAGMTKATLEQAKTGVADLETGIAAVQEQAKGGEIEAAIAKAGDLKAKGMELMKSIGMAQ